MIEIQIGTIIRDYIFIEELGRGGFSIVYKVINQKYQDTFVAKVISINSSQNRSSINLFEAEIKSLMKINHPNVIKLYDFFRENDFFILILEYCPGGTLQDELEKKNFFSGDRLNFICCKLLEALNACHLNGIAHRDIKTSNILIGKYDQIKLSDFGLSHFKNNFDSKSENFCGTFIYKSPEILRNTRFDPFKADIWALGIVFYELSTGKLPWNFNNFNELKKQICTQIINPPETININFINIILLMTQHDPNKRPIVENLLLQPIFYENNKIIKNNKKKLTRNSLSLVQKSFSLKRPNKSLTNIFYPNMTFESDCEKKIESILKC